MIHLITFFMHEWNQVYLVTPSRIYSIDIPLSTGGEGPFENLVHSLKDIKKPGCLLWFVL